MVLSWLRNRRRTKLLAEPFPQEWLAHVQRNVGHFALLEEPQQAKLCQLARVFVAEKHWEGCGGLALDDEIRVTIAAGASLLALGVQPNYYFDSVRTVLVYPDAYRHPDDGNVFHGDGGLGMLGESWQYGPIVVSWKPALESLRDPGSGHNLVLHEFAHHLDGLDGYTDGTPPMGSRRQARTWYRVTEQEYQRLVRQSSRGRPTLLDHYGASNRAEFFAVATECFFEKPVELRRRHAELYAVLREFYRLDPAGWRWDAVRFP